MLVTLLGTGTAMPSSRRLQSGTLIEWESRRLLVDCGSGVVHRLKQVGVDHRDVSTILLTHHHLDHVADLATLFKARILSGCPDITILGPPGTREVCDRLFAHDDLDSRGSAEIREFSNEGRLPDVLGMSLTVANTIHTTSSVAYRIGDTLVISGDTAPSDSVFSLADGAHTLIHECSYPDSVETDTHTTPGQLRAGIRGIDIERVVLTHLSPEAESHLDEIGDTFIDDTAAHVVIGEDRMRLALPC